SQEIWQLIKHINVAMLTTQSGEQLRARPMYQVQSKFDGTLWFITSESSAKADELSDNKQVCLAYADVQKDVYVSLSGTADLTPDRALIAKFWNPIAEAWFEDGSVDDDVTLLEIRVEQAQVWDAHKNAMTLLFEQVRARLTDAPPAPGENRKYG
ncbi:MAG: pyridoxamine 5'-phosphate oxidase family protein, partial [Pseudohongiellaceae bacterium]